MRVRHHQKGTEHKAFGLTNQVCESLARSVEEYAKGPHNQDVVKAVLAFIKSNSKRGEAARKIRDHALSTAAFSRTNIPTTVLPLLRALVDIHPHGFVASATGKRPEIFAHLFAKGHDYDLEGNPIRIRAFTKFDYAARGLKRAVAELAANLDEDQFFEMVEANPVRIFKKAVEFHTKSAQLTEMHLERSATLRDQAELEIQLHGYHRTHRVLECVAEALAHGRVTKHNAHIWMEAMRLHFLEGQPVWKVATYVQNELEELGVSHPSRKAWTAVVHRAFASMKRYIRSHHDPKDLLDHGGDFDHDNGGSDLA